MNLFLYKLNNTKMNTTNKNMNTNDNEKTLLFQIQILLQMDLQQYHLIKNINEIGTIMDKNNEKVSEITPLIMVLNQNKINCQDKVNEMINQGADPNMKIQYWGESKSAIDIMNETRKNIKLN